MSVYVDNLVDYGWTLGPSCHMYADTESELHNMARSIGLTRSCFQTKTMPHYDLVASKRYAAIMNGAKDVDCRFTGHFIRRMKNEGK